MDPGETLTLLRARDAGAQAQLREQLFPRVLGTCLQILRDEVAAREMAEDIWTDFLFGKVDGIEHPRAMAAYLKLMAVRRCRRLRERSARHTAAVELQHQGPDPERLVLEAHDVVRQHALLAACLELLSPKAHQVVRLRYAEELTQEEIGVRIGASKQYAGRVLGRSLEQLRRCMEKRP